VSVTIQRPRGDSAAQTMSSWADEANGNESVDQENFKAERIISQTPDGREKVLFSAMCIFAYSLPAYKSTGEKRR